MATDGLSARPWLLLPGTLCSGAVFDGLLDGLAVPRNTTEIISLDRPHVEDYADICAKSGPDTVVCGFSLGAIVAAHWSDRVTAYRLIFFGINPHADDPDKRQGRLDLARDVALSGGAAALRSRMPELHGPTPDAARIKILSMADQTEPQIDAQTRLALNRPGALPALSRARAPVFSLNGSQDTAAPPDYGRAAANAAPSGLFNPLEGLGHFALLEDPMACAAMIAQMEARFDDTDRS